jgi:plasmid replication initiation protein
LKNEREDILYLKKELLLKGMPFETVDKMNYQELSEILNARPRDKRPVNAGNLFKKFM